MAFGEDGGQHDVVVVILDMTKYLRALAEISTARGVLGSSRFDVAREIAAISERAGRFRGLAGSLTIMPVVVCSEEEGAGRRGTLEESENMFFLCDGRIVLSRELHRRAIYPPIDVLHSFSRFQRSALSAVPAGSVPLPYPYQFLQVENQLYHNVYWGHVARTQRMGSWDDDEIHLYLRSLELFEQDFLSQRRDEDRSFKTTVEEALCLLRMFPASMSCYVRFPLHNPAP